MTNAVMIFKFTTLINLSCFSSLGKIIQKKLQYFPRTAYETTPKCQAMLPASINSFLFTSGTLENSLYSRQIRERHSAWLAIP